MTDRQIAIRDAPDAHRFEISLDGQLAGYAEYVLGPNTIVFTHTVIDEAFNGRGLGSRLAKYVLTNARERGLRVRPKCPFIRSYIERHKEFADLVTQT